MPDHQAIKRKLLRAFQAEPWFRGIGLGEEKVVLLVAPEGRAEAVAALRGRPDRSHVEVRAMGEVAKRRDPAPPARRRDKALAADELQALHAAARERGAS